jgi:hypothetical protein
LDVNVHQPGNEVLAARVDAPAGFAAGELTRCDRCNARPVDDYRHVGLGCTAGAFDDGDVIDDQPFRVRE